MAEKTQFLDIWILQTNTVYRKVPYTVVTDWVQQGRLLAEDKLCLTGTNNWVALNTMPAFAAFLPKIEPFRVEDQAEALEAVQVEMTWKKRPHDEDDDVDMIPLIDISLVLLIFFMMTATVGSAGSLFDTPEARYKLLSVQPEMVWIGMKKDEGGFIHYTFGKGEGGKGVEFGASKEALLRHLETELDARKMVDVNIQAAKDLPFEAVGNMTVDLIPFKRQGKVANIYTGVREKP